MRKLLLSLFILTITVNISKAQYNWDFGVHAGASNYLGEMGGKADTRKDFIMDIKLSKTQFTGGAFARYKFTPLISAKLGLNYVRIEGADNTSTNPGRAGRNLSFQNNIYELDLQAQVFFYEIPDLGRTYRYRNDFKMYAFAGVAGYYHNPKTMYQGSWVKLQPLQTEGVQYKKIGVSIPLGIGLYLH